jgi:hypothetical protein
MKNRIIRERFGALTALSQRSLPSSTAISKTTALLTSRFKPANEVIDRRIKDVYAEFPLPDGDEATALPIALAEKRQRAIDAILDESQPIRKIPDHMRLTAADMPKALTGTDGWKNNDELASIRVLLGSLYAWGADEKLADNEQGEELDGDAGIEHAAPLVDDPHSTKGFEA